MIYFFHFLLIFLYMCIFLLSPQTRLYKKIFIGISFFQTFLLYALRNISVGTDTYLMAISYADTRVADLYLDAKAPLYELIRDIFHLVIPSSQGYMVMCGVFIIGGTAIYIYRHSKDILLSTFLFFSLYFFFFAMNGARQTIAIVLIANGMMGVLENKKILSFLLFFSALFIHSTSIMMIPILALLFFKSPMLRRMFFVCYCFGLIFYNQFVSLFTGIFSKYAFYVSSGYLFEMGNNRKIILTLFYALLTLAAGWVYNKMRFSNTSQENARWEFCIFCSIATVIIGVIALRSVILTRMEYYFSFNYLLFIPLILKKIQREGRFLVAFLTWIILAIPGIFQFVNNFGNVRPYLFFWE